MFEKNKKGTYLIKRSVFFGHPIISITSIKKSKSI